MYILIVFALSSGVPAMGSDGIFTERDFSDTASTLNFVRVCSRNPVVAIAKVENIGPTKATPGSFKYALTVVRPFFDNEQQPWPKYIVDTPSKFADGIYFISGTLNAIDRLISAMPTNYLSADIVIKLVNEKDPQNLKAA